MALTEEREKATWLTAQSGIFLRLVPEGTPGATSRVNKLQKTVWEKRYEAVEGYITRVKMQEPPADKPEYGKALIVFMQDDKDRYAVRIPLSSSYALGFLSRMKNIDASKKCELRIFDKPREDNPEKKQRVLFVQQDGKTVAPIWSKENAGEGEDELPGLTCVKPATKTKPAIWSDDERLEFFESFVTRHGAMFSANSAAPATDEQPEVDAEHGEEPVTDLPF